MAVKKSDLIKAGKYPPKSDKLTKEELKQKFLKDSSSKIYTNILKESMERTKTKQYLYEGVSHIFFAEKKDGKQVINHYSLLKTNEDKPNFYLKTSPSINSIYVGIRTHLYNSHISPLKPKELKHAEHYQFSLKNDFNNKGIERNFIALRFQRADYTTDFEHGYLFDLKTFTTKKVAIKSISTQYDIEKFVTDNQYPFSKNEQSPKELHYYFPEMVEYLIDGFKP